MMERGIFARAADAARNWMSDEDGRSAQRIHPSRLRFIVSKLLERRNLHLVEAEPLSPRGLTRLVARGTGHHRDTQHVVYIAGAPKHDRVRPQVLEALSEDVDKTGASAGWLVTPYHIDRGLWEPGRKPIRLIDGLELERLVDHHLPNLRAELARYRLVGTTCAFAGP